MPVMREHRISAKIVVDVPDPTRKKNLFDPSKRSTKKDMLFEFSIKSLVILLILIIR